MSIGTVKYRGINLQIHKLYTKLTQLPTEEFSENVVGAGKLICELFDLEEHSGFSISFFSRNFRRLVVQIYREAKTPDNTWIVASDKIEVSFGAGKMEEKARSQFFSRLEVLDKFNITTAEDVDRVLAIVECYVRDTPIQPLNLRDDGIWSGENRNVLRECIDYPRLVKTAEGKVLFSCGIIFHQHNGGGWFSNKNSTLTVTEDMQQPIKAYSIILGSDGLPQLDNRTCEIGAQVADVYNQTYLIECKLENNRYRLKDVTYLNACDPSHIEVTESDLLKETFFVEDLDQVIPLYRKTVI